MALGEGVSGKWIVGKSGVLGKRLSGKWLRANGPQPEIQIIFGIL